MFRTKIDKADIAAVETLVRASGVFNAEETIIARELVEEALSRGHDATGYFFLMAGGAGALDGYTCYGPIPGTDARFELYWIAVNPDTRGQGLGRKLLEATEAMVRKRGAKYLFAETSSRSDYKPAHALYHGCGFSEQAHVADFYADGDGLMIFGKKL
ncbi:MAG TPA: GNAT family N-acetyltransferase [Rhizomicrobium sp.]|nr:GNAT family N-acetyltransferase [Rhizomicrobium sp.]